MGKPTGRGKERLQTPPPSLALDGPLHVCPSHDPAQSAQLWLNQGLAPTEEWAYQLPPGETHPQLCLLLVGDLARAQQADSSGALGPSRSQSPGPRAWLLTLPSAPGWLC